jgi:hypothetical protein
MCQDGQDRAVDYDWRAALELSTKDIDFVESVLPDLVMQDQHMALQLSTTLRPTVVRLIAAIRARVTTPTMRANLNRFALQLVANSVADIKRLIRCELARWSQFVIYLKLKML